MPDIPRPAKSRHVAMCVDVEARVLYAVSSGQRQNPYPVDDKRHDRFNRKLGRHDAIASDFDDICDVMGADTSQWVRRVHPNPGPVLPLNALTA